MVQHSNYSNDKRRQQNITDLPVIKSNLLYWYKLIQDSVTTRERQVDPPSWQRKSSDSRDVTRVGWVKLRAAGKRHRNEEKVPTRNLMTCSKHQDFVPRLFTLIENFCATILKYRAKII